MRTRISKIDPYTQILGTASDRSVAERAGVSIQAVRDYRKRRGIPSCITKKRAQKAATSIVRALTAPLERALLPPWMPSGLAEAVMDLQSRLSASGITTITLTPTTVEGQRATIENWKVNL